MRDPLVIPGPAGLDRYDGGKGGAGVAQWIINQMPPHERYVEAFVGSGRIIRTKAAAKTNIVIDADQRIARMWGSDRPGCRYFVRGNVTHTLTAWHADAVEFLSKWGDTSPEPTFIYCDPPYLMSSRSCQQNLYPVEFATEDEHRRLIAVLKSLPCMVALSGYASELYAIELKDWRLSTFRTVDRRGKPKLEHLWMNYPAPTILHDWRFYGRTFGHRQRFKRKVARWQNRLASMPEIERNALLAYLSGIPEPEMAAQDPAGCSRAESDSAGRVVSC